MKKGTKIVIGIIVIAAIVVIAILNGRPRSTGELVETELAAHKPMVAKVVATGELKAETQVSVQPQIVARVTKLYVEEGDIVTKGQTVCELDPTNYRNAAELARIAVTQIARTYARSESLYRQKLISPEAYEQVRLQYDNALAQQQAADDQLAMTTITAPVSGRIVQLNVKEGEMAIAGMVNVSGSVMMTIADLTSMLAIVEANETDVPAIKPGQTASISLDAFPDTTFSATVKRIGYMPIQTLLTATEKSTKFRIELQLAQPTDALRPGMTASAEIITSQRDSILSVPIQAIGRRRVKGADVQSLFVLKDGAAHLIPVKTGISSDTDTEILEGIASGDTVITGPYKVLSKLKDGAKVRVSIAAGKAKSIQADSAK